MVLLQKCTANARIFWTVLIELNKQCMSCQDFKWLKKKENDSKIVTRETTNKPLGGFERKRRRRCFSALLVPDRNKANMSESGIMVNLCIIILIIIIMYEENINKIWKQVRQVSKKITITYEIYYNDGAICFIPTKHVSVVTALIQNNTEMIVHILHNVGYICI